MKVVAINGSARENGNTAQMLQCVLQELQAEGIETELIQLAGREIHGCRACYACAKQKNGKCAWDDDFLNECLEKIVAADGLLLGSPTYFADVTSEMKALIDRIGFVVRANGDLLARKVGAAVVAVRRGGSIHAFDTMNHFFLISQMIIPGSRYWNLGLGLDKGQVAQDAEGIETMQYLGRNMAWLLKRLESAPA